MAIKQAKISAVLAQSFARIFFRNCINIGLPAIECDTEKIKAGDILELDLDRGEVLNRTRNIKIKFSPLPEMMQKILLSGGMVNYMRKKGRKQNGREI